MSGLIDVRRASSVLLHLQETGYVYYDRKVEEQACYVRKMENARQASRQHLTPR